MIKADKDTIQMGAMETARSRSASSAVTRELSVQPIFNAVSSLRSVVVQGRRGDISGQCCLDLMGTARELAIYGAFRKHCSQGVRGEHRIDDRIVLCSPLFELSQDRTSGSPNMWP